MGSNAIFMIYRTSRVRALCCWDDSKGGSGDCRGSGQHLDSVLHEAQEVDCQQDAKL